MTQMMDQPKLQAVLLADSFLTTFQPLSLDQPKVLCPLNNVPMLHYTLDCLAGNGVEHVVCICTDDAVEDYLSFRPPGSSGNKSTTTTTSHWQGQFTVDVIKDTSLANAGDALRELYKRNWIQSDPFLLVYGDVVTNMDLKDAMEAHKARHASDSAAIMTAVFQASGDMAPIQSAKQDLVIGYDEDKACRLLLYDDNSSSNKVRLPCSFFASHPGMTVRTDVLDTGMYICSPDVLGRFEDEFDYLDISKDFIANCVAEEEEGLQTRIHAHFLAATEYAARIVDGATYHAVSHDLLRRWCYPIVSDNLHYSPPASALPTSSSSSKHQLYKARHSYDWYKESTQPSKIARSVTLVGPGILGSRGKIAPHAKIEASVLGHDIQIGSHASIQNSHLWDGVVVEDGAIVEDSILAKHSIIKKGAVIKKCIIGQGCVIGSEMVLPEYTRITLQEPEEDPFGDGDDDWGDDDKEEGSDDLSSPQDDEPGGLVSETDIQVVGKDGKGHVWIPSLEDDEESEDDDDEKDSDNENIIDALSTLQLQSIGTDLKGHYKKRLQRQAEAADDGLSDNEADAEAARMEDEAFIAYTEGAFTFADDSTTIPVATTTAVMTAAASTVVGRQKGVDVVKELKEICMEFDDNGNTPMENLAIELNSYKFSQNASYSDCTMAAILAIVEKMQITADMTDGKLVTGIKQKMEFWASLLQKMSIGQPEEISIIHGLERAATAETPAANKLSSGLSFRFLLQALHDEEVLSEEALLAWAESRKSEPSADTPIGKLFQLPSVQDFLEWLEEDSEDEDDESSSGEDSD